MDAKFDGLDNDTPYEWLICMYFARDDILISNTYDLILSLVGFYLKKFGLNLLISYGE